MHALDGALSEYIRHERVCNLSALIDLTGTTDGDGLQKKARGESKICKSGTHAHKKPTQKKQEKKPRERKF